MWWLPTGLAPSVQLNEDVARANPYNGDKLHLEMNAEPYDNAHNGEFGGGQVKT